MFINTRANPSHVIAILKTEAIEFIIYLTTHHPLLPLLMCFFFTAILLVGHKSDIRVKILETTAFENRKLQICLTIIFKREKKLHLIKRFSYFSTIFTIYTLWKLIFFKQPYPLLCDEKERFFMLTGINKLPFTALISKAKKKKKEKEITDDQMHSRLLIVILATGFFFVSWLHKYV